MKQFFKHIILKLIQKIEGYEYRNLSLDENDIDKKIIETYDISNLNVKTDTGYKPVSHFHVTQPYKVYKIVLENGYYLECADNHIVFTKGFNQIFVKDLSINEYIITDTGLSKVIKIESYNVSVGMCDLTIDSEDHRYYTNGILSHNTVVAGIFLTHYLLFNYDKNILIAANKGATAQEILKKIKDIIINLPFFLQSGVIKFNEYSIATDANSRILATTTTEKSAVGFTIHCLYLDEFAHVRPKIQKTFFDNIYPVISASKKSKLIITSTPNGFDLFQELYDKSVKGENEFKNMSVPYWMVPGRDEKWAANQISNMGEEAFNEQFGCQFLRSDLLLLNANELKVIKSNQKSFIYHEIPSLKNYNLTHDNLLWLEGYDLDNLKNEFLIFSLDLSEGIGKDYQSLQIYRIIPKFKHDIQIPLNEVWDVNNHFLLEQIGLYRDNNTTIPELAKLIYVLIYSKMFDQEHIKFIVEWNTYGSFFVEKMKNTLGGNLFDEGIFYKSFHRKGAINKNIGIRQTPETKDGNCALVKEHISKGNLLIHDKWTINEFNYFQKGKNGKYAAAKGNDDNVMSLINLLEIYRYSDFAYFVEELFDLLPHEDKNYIDNAINSNNYSSIENEFDDYSIFNSSARNGNLDTNDDWF